MARPRRTWWSIFSPLTLLYVLTGHRGYLSNDALVASSPAWSLVHRGTLFVDRMRVPLSTPEIANLHGHLRAIRTPGVILAALPLNVVLAPLDLEPQDVGALTAGLMTAAAMATLALVLRRLVQPHLAAAGALTLALGTCFWPNASGELWTHGPDALWLSLLLLAAWSRRPWLALVGATGAALTRPHLAVVAAAVAVWVLVELKDRRTAAAAVLGGPLALALSWCWYAYYVGQGSFFGPLYGQYAPANVARVGGGGPSLVGNVAGTLLSPGYGLVWYTPVVVPLAVMAIRKLWNAPRFALAAGAGGVLYLGVQLRVNAFQGGTGFYGYRLPLETLLLLAPLAVVAYEREQARLLRATVIGLAGVSVGVMAYGALNNSSWPGVDVSRAWHFWYPLEVWRTGGGLTTSGLVAAVGISALGIAWGLRVLEPAAAAEQPTEPTLSLPLQRPADPSAAPYRPAEPSAAPYRPAEPSALRASGSSTPQSMSRSVSRLGDAS